MRKPFDGNFSLTQTFGNVLIINGVNIYAQWGYKGHNGLDYGTPIGTKILAPHDGQVIEAQYDANGYGNYVKLENDVEGSVLGHLKELIVKPGQWVKQGDLLGYSGNTGNSTGPHLHWGYFKKPRDRQNGYGGFIDQLPMLLLPEPNPGYAPTFEGMTVVKDGIQYKSYKKDGVLLWKIEVPSNPPVPTEPMITIKQSEYDGLKAQIVTLSGANERLTASVALKEKECQDKLQAQKVELIQKIINLTSNI